MPHAAAQTTAPRHGAVVACAEAAAALSVIVAVAVVPIVLSDRTPYALDVKWLWSGGCALAAAVALLAWRAAGGRLGPQARPLAVLLGLFFCTAAASAAVSDYRDAALREAFWYGLHLVFFLAAAVAFPRDLRLLGELEDLLPLDLELVYVRSEHPTRQHPRKNDTCQPVIGHLFSSATSFSATRSVA